MRSFITFQRLLGLMPAFVMLFFTALATGCGNKGDLYLDGGELFVETTPVIEDALDELEVLEAEEADESDSDESKDEQEEKEES